MDVFEETLAWWREYGLQLESPVSETIVARVFDELGCPVSSDVLRLYSLCDGFANGDTLGRWSLWPVAYFTEVSPEETPDNDFPLVEFADWMVSQHTYCFRYESPEISSIYLNPGDHDQVPRRIANSIEEFLIALRKNPDRVGISKADWV